MSEPKRRTDRLIVREVAGESVVYDLDTDTVHALPEQTARLWAAADGTRSVDQLRLLAGMSEQEAVAVLASLEDKGLMQVGASGLSRRTVLQAAAVGAGALAIGSVAVPANAQTALASVCIDQNPLDGGTLCSTLANFFNNPGQFGTGLSFPSSGCTPGDVGIFDPACPGFGIFYKETNSTQWSAIGNLKTTFSLCTTPAPTPAGGVTVPTGTKYIQMKGGGGQSFPIYDPNTLSPPGTCGGTLQCRVLVDLTNTNSFIFGFTVPVGAGGPLYLRTSICFPATTGSQPQYSFNFGDPTKDPVKWAGNGSAFTAIPFNTVTTVCTQLDPTSPLLALWFKNPNQQAPQTGIWIDAAVSSTACP